MTAQEMGFKILELIRDEGDASFAGMMKRLGAEAKGELSIELMPNVVLWSGVSPTFIEAIQSIRSSTEIYLTSPLVYWADGMTMSMPVAKRIPSDGFKSPKWAPTVLKLKKSPTSGTSIATANAAAAIRAAEEEA